MKDKNTEKRILQAAISVFQRKGMAGARMQEIADEANINKAMLHYYFRSKQQLFEAVFMGAFAKLAPQLNFIFASEAPLFEKIKAFVSGYIDFITENPYLPSFIIQELNNNPEFVNTFLSHEGRPNPAPFLKQIEGEIEAGTIKKIHPKHLLIDLLSLCAFPFVAKSMLTVLLELPEGEFDQLMEERKTKISQLIIENIQA
jgi:AcrR family transcriptional regulator